MQISRRAFLRYCALASASLGLGPKELTDLEEALADPQAPSVLWLQGSGCSGCTISFLNYIVAVGAGRCRRRADQERQSPLSPDSVCRRGRIGRGRDQEGEQVHSARRGRRADGLWRPCLYPMVGRRPGSAFPGGRADPLGKGDRRSSVWGPVRPTAGSPRWEPTRRRSRACRRRSGRNTINVSGCPPHPNWIVETLVHAAPGQDRGSGRPGPAGFALWRPQDVRSMSRSTAGERPEVLA